MMCQYVQIRGFHIIVALVDSIGSVLNCVVLGENMCTYSVVPDCLHIRSTLHCFLHVNYYVLAVHKYSRRTSRSRHKLRSCVVMWGGN